MRHRRELSVTAVLVALLAILALFAPHFFDSAPLLSFAAREAPTWLVGAGMALVIITRQIDLSVGSQFAVCGVAAGLVAQAHSPVLAVVVSIALGGALGAVNGALIAGLRLPSVVVTLATMVAWREGLRWWRQGQFVFLPEGMQWLGLSQANGQLCLIGLALLAFAMLAVAAQRLAVGRWIFAVGSHEEAARLAGLPVRTVTFGACVTLGLLTGLAAAMNLLQSPQVDPKAGTGLELRVIAAAVVGGVSISGGRGNLWGVLAGCVLLACVGPTLTYLHVEPYWDRAIEGTVILVAVATDGWGAKSAPRIRRSPTEKAEGPAR